MQSPIIEILEKLHQSLLKNREGEVANYIPELGKADPEWFGICVVTADGQIYEVGDTGQHFTIQSISKPFVYGMALEDNGKSEVLKKSGWSRRGRPSMPSACAKAPASRPIP